MKMRGYYKDRQLQGHVLTVEGWFKPWTWRASGDSALSLFISRLSADIIVPFAPGVSSSNNFPYHMIIGYSLLFFNYLVFLNFQENKDVESFGFSGIKGVYSICYLCSISLFNEMMNQLDVGSSRLFWCN